MSYEYKRQIADAIALACGLDVADVLPGIETPPNSEMGDFAFPCFKSAKTLRKAPQAIAADISGNIVLPTCVERIEVLGGYVNFFLNKAEFAENTVSAAIREGNRFGSTQEGTGKNVCVEYSSINIAKPFHIAHLYTTVIGSSLSRIYRHLGYATISINHLGDWGTQFGKLIVAYKLWGDDSKIEQNSVKELMQLYVRYHAEAEKDASLDEEAREWFKKIEEHEPEATRLLKWFTELTLESVGRVYDMLGVKFDSYAGESFYADMIPAVIDELNAKGLLKLDDGAYIVDLEEYNMPPCLILKRDGASLYTTRDITAAIYRKKTYDFYKLLYVVASHQELHFRQFFKVIELMGHEWVKDMEHVSYGMVSLEEGTLSTRHGNVVLLEDVLNAAIDKTKRVMEEKSPDLENPDEIARQVGVGAVIWSPLYNTRIKDVVFSWERVLNFDGETGPYAQYTHARCCSVLRKAGIDKDSELQLIDKLCGDCMTDAQSAALVRSIAELPNSIKQAAEKNEPYVIARRVIEICGNYNRFYYDHRIIGEDEPMQSSRLALTVATRNALRVGLHLVGLDAPEKM